MPDSSSGSFLTNSEARQSRLIRIIAISGLVILATTLGTELYFNTQLIVIAVAGLGVLNLLISLWLVQTGRTNTARFILPGLSWIVVNVLSFLLPTIHPLLFISINIVVLLLAGALLDHYGVLVFASLTIGLSVAITFAELNGLISVFLRPGENWLSAGPVFALAIIFAYYAFRDRHRAMQEATRRAQETETLLQASHAVATSLEMTETIERILVQLELVVPYDTASAQILKDGVLEIVGGRGWDESAQVIGIQFPVPGDNPNTRVIETRQAYILDDARQEFEAFRQPPHDHIRSVLGVPLILGDKLIGMLSVDHRKPAFYDQSHARLVQAFADQVALAIANAQHFQAEQRRRQLAAMQQDITQITSASLELEEVVQRVASLTCQALEADVVIILVTPQHGQGNQSVEIHNCNQELADELLQEIKDDLLPNLTDDILAQIVPQYGASRLNLALSNLTGDKAAALRAWSDGRQGLVVPLIAAGHSTGVMLSLRLTEDSNFPDSSLEMAESIAQSVATSIENATLYAQVQRMAITDELTNIYNRRGLTQVGQREIERANRYDRPFSVLMADLDRFKQLNDTYGHPAGDEVLRQFAHLLSQLVRSIDVVARYGGEEFVILLPECSQDCAQVVAERLRRAVEDHTFQTSAGELQITISLGLTSGSNLPLDLEALLKSADQALYAAKEAGRNQYWLWHPDGPRPFNH